MHTFLNGKYTEAILSDIKDHVIIECKKVALVLEYLKESKVDNNTRMDEILIDIQGESKLYNVGKPYDRVCYTLANE